MPYDEGGHFYMPEVTSVPVLPDNSKNELVTGAKACLVLAADTIVRKNKSYATEEDCWRAFRLAETLGLSVEAGLLVRMSDKLSRLASLLIGDGKDEVGEAAKDTALDLAAYSAILWSWITQNRNIDVRNGDGVAEIKLPALDPEGAVDCKSTNNNEAK